MLKRTDLIAGTSIGGIIALLLANNVPIKTIVQACDNATTFFTQSILRRIGARLGLCAFHDNTGQRDILSKFFGTTTLGQLEKYVVIQTFQLDGKPIWASKVLHNIPSIKGAKFESSLDTLIGCSPDILAVDAGLATSAAPMYFPAAGSYIDGGVCNNNPAMTALALTQDTHFEMGNIPLNDINVFSLGRIYPGDTVDRTNFDAGFFGWTTIIVQMLLTANSSVADYQAGQILGDKFFRHSPFVPPDKKFALDNVAHIPSIIDWAQQIDLTNEISWIKNNW